MIKLDDPTTPYLIDLDYCKGAGSAWRSAVGGHPDGARGDLSFAGQLGTAVPDGGTLGPDCASHERAGHVTIEEADDAHPGMLRHRHTGYRADDTPPPDAPPGR